MGRLTGGFLYYVDCKHRSLAYANIKTAFGSVFSPREIKKITRRFYRNFGQNIIELFLLPKIDKEYLRHYVTMSGKENVTEAFKHGKGVILMAFHAGSWELSNTICADFVRPFSIIFREQRLPRLNRLLNSYRLRNGCNLIQRNNQTRGIVEALMDNQGIGMTIDQGGARGILVKFFGRNASMATGALRLGLKYGVKILPAFYTRINGPYQKVIIDKPFELVSTGDKDRDIQVNLQELVHVFERLISQYPHEYLWTYKIWKYSAERNVLVLSDNKAGHLRQSQTAVGILEELFKEKGIKANITTLKVEFKTSFARHFLSLSTCFSGKYSCQGCLWCLNKSLKNDTYNELIKIKPDIIISAGASLSPVSYLLSKENRAKSVVLMRPSLLGVKNFDLVIMPQHDRPPKRKNVCVTEGALNLIGQEYLGSKAEEFKKLLTAGCQLSKDPVGLLIGGDTKNFHLDEKTISTVLTQIKMASGELGIDILATTSRRTPDPVEKIVRDELSGFERCKKLVIASLDNPLCTIGGILSLSSIAVVSPESISMISEAVASAAYVVVFDSQKLDRKHKDFLGLFARKGYIYLIDPVELSGVIKQILKKKPAKSLIKDRMSVKEALRKIL